jgi:RNA polymerase subunit RPABC4/transcription elongation factor Spt4
MSPPRPACLRCGAALAADQEFCLECGARQAAPASSQWRRVLIAAAITVALAALVLALGYEQMRDDAESEAGTGGAARGKVLRQAAANARADSSDRRTPARPGPPAAAQTP